MQILKRLKNYEVKIQEFNENYNYRDEIEKIIGEHIEKFGKKEEIKYNGIISVIKISS